jgi:N-hydroxyarylamine O-acetyltransferase
MDIKAYLNRIGFEKVREPSLEFLTDLQNRHLLSIPFEDLDIPGRNRIELNLDKIYNKIIPAKRGGFCYELNGLFHWLLTSLGFRVDMLSARVFNSQKNDFGPEYDHMTLLVHLDKDYLVDIGFGDSFRRPIEMPDGEVEDVSGYYKILKKEDKLFELLKKEENGFEKQYCFTTDLQRLEDYKEMCAFQQDSTTSHFRTRMLCTIATETGRITLSNNSLTMTENGIKTKTEFTDEKEFYFLLKKHFGIVLD